jgi:hypothetical protein
MQHNSALSCKVGKKGYLLAHGYFLILGSCLGGCVFTRKNIFVLIRNPSGMVLHPCGLKETGKTAILYKSNVEIRTEILMHIINALILTFKPCSF